MSRGGYSLSYPRRRVQRGLARMAGRALIPLLARVEVTGAEHFPRGGPLLVVGNHVAAMEVALMVVYAPWQIEMLGPGDIPTQGALGAISRLYGHTPIRRGQPDRAALARSLDVLAQGGVVGLFPEGGVWETGQRSAKRGVAWLSQRAQAPILPIGFGGVEGALEAMFRLQRPTLTMNVGPPFPAVTGQAGRSRKESMQEAADRVMQAVEGLIPETGRPRRSEILDERFALQVTIEDGAGRAVPQPAERGIAHAEALVKFFYRPALLKIYRHDLHLPVDVLQRLGEARDPAPIAAALRLVLGYLEQENPYFLTYRYGQAEGRAMEAGLRELHALAEWAAGEGVTLRVSMIRRYRLPGREEEVVELSPGEAHPW